MKRRVARAPIAPSVVPLLGGGMRLAGLAVDDAAPMVSRLSTARCQS